jgi:cell division protein FtsI (penicillin-binding protein 3)
MGFAPATNPVVTIVVTLNGSSKYGGVIAAPVFKEIAQTCMRVMSVPPDNLDPQTLLAADSAPAPADLPMVAMNEEHARLLHAEADAALTNSIPIGEEVPDFVGKPIRSVIEEAAAKGFRVEMSGAGIAREQDPAPGTRLVDGQKVRVRFER